MKQVILSEKAEGILVERVIRDYEFSMPIKHFHPEYEIYYLIEGDRYYFIESETFYIQEGTLVFINANDIHKTDAAKSSFHDRLLLSIKGEWLNPFLHALGFSSIETFFNSHKIFPLSVDSQKVIQKLIEEIAYELKEEREGYEYIVKMKLTQILIYLLRYQNASPFPLEQRLSQSTKHKKVQEITTYIQNHLHRKLTLELLAQNFYISKGHLSHIFKDVTGLTVTEYINIQRIRYAKTLLESSMWNMTRISEMCGYDSITYFEKVFRKYNNTSPLKYRQMINHN